MDIKEYRYITEIAKQGGISKAAAALYISQPSLSLYLKNLEERLGIKLFDTSSGAARPTEAGKIYLEYAQQILGIDSSLMQIMDGIKRAQTGVVRIGITGTRSTYIIPSLLKYCKEMHPGIELRISENNTEELEYRVFQKRDLDIILANAPFRSGSLSSQLLFREELLMAIPKSFLRNVPLEYSPETDIPWVNLVHLKDIPFTLLKPGHRLRQLADALFVSYGIRPDILLETQRMETALSMAHNELSACFVYDSVYLRYVADNITFCWLGKTPSYLNFVAAFNDESLNYPPVRTILETIVSVVGKEREALLHQNILKCRRGFPSAF